MTPHYFFMLATLLFSMGLVGVVSRRNLFVIYMSIELMLSAVNLILATFSRLHGDMHGSVIALVMIAVIAAEAALFLAMIVHLKRSRSSLDTDRFTTLAQREGTE
jgi:NADH-quinone oxidoreductase subunit K